MQYIHNQQDKLIDNEKVLKFEVLFIAYLTSILNFIHLCDTVPSILDDDMFRKFSSGGRKRSKLKRLSLEVQKGQNILF